MKSTPERFTFICTHHETTQFHGCVELDLCEHWSQNHGIIVKQTEIISYRVYFEKKRKRKNIKRIQKRNKHNKEMNREKES